MHGTKFYTGMYYEKFQKPWCSGFEVWFERTNYDNKVAVIYGDSIFANYGLSMGVKKTFDKEDLHFPFPQRDVHLHQV
jgi:hypothetical protein